MPSIPPDYSRVFSNLCHVVALTREGKIQQVSDNLVITVIALHDETPLSSAGEVVAAIQTKFGLTLRDTIVQSSLDRLIGTGRVLRYRGSPIYHLTLTEDELVKRRVTETNALEESVKHEWFESTEVLRAMSAPRQEQMWQCLRAYMARIFNRHGAETIQLLNPNIPRNPLLERSLPSMLNDAMSVAGIANGDKDVVGEAIECFFENVTPLRAKYVTQLLDGTFSFFALSVDDATSQYLRRDLARTIIFLDTNFILGVLGISPNFLVDVAHELITLVQQRRLPFHLYYHEQTLVEIEDVIYGIGNTMRAQRWSSAVSRAAITNGYLSGLEFQYHEKNAEMPIDPAIFMSKYAHVAELLREQGFREYKGHTEDNEYVMEKGKHIAAYQAYIEETRPDRRKRYETLNHDIVVWMAVEKLRHDGSSALDIGALFLTFDYIFQRFDWQHLRTPGTIGSVVLPNHLLQLLRPFLPTTDDFDRRFVETFAIPEFRTSTADYSATRSSVLSYINTYSDVTTETAVRILAKEMMLEQLKSVDSESDAFKEIIDNAILRENQEMLDEKRKADEEKAAAVALLETRENELEQARERLAASEAARVDATKETTGIKDQLANLNLTVSAQQQSHDIQMQRIWAIMRYTLGGVAGCVGSIALILFAVYTKWT